ncbi:MAG: hypothetical protein J2P45_11665, partial [Candidatus Dormibacteraeota bacterium]|nr:hypothetical protein [Candidatus Dormibacteraeota bacterium]
IFDIDTEFLPVLGPSPGLGAGHPARGARLSALEETGQPGSSPQLRLETVARLTNSWVQALLNLVGQEKASLPEPIR